MADDLLVRARLRDELTQPLRAVEAQVERTARATRRLAASGHMASGRRGLGGLDRITRPLRTNLRGLHQSVTGLSRSLGRELAQGLRRSALGVAGLTGAIGFFGLKAASQFQQTRIALDGFLGSAEAGGRMFADLKQLNLETPFELGDVAAGARQLLGFGFAGEQVLPVLKSVTDAAAGLGGGADTLQGLLLNLGQVRTQGKVTGRELRDFAVRGFPGYEIVADILGVTTDQVRALGDEAEVSGDQFIKAVIGMGGPLQRFAGMAEKQMASLAGQWSNLKDRVTMSLVDAAEPAAQALTAAMPGIIDAAGTLIDTVGPPVFRLVSTLADLLSKALPVLAPLFEALVGGIEKLLTTAAPALGLLEPVIDELVVAIGDLVTELVPVMPDLVHGFILLVGVLPDLVRLLGMLIPLISPMVRLLDTLLGFAPTRGVLVGILGAILAYRAVAGIVGGVWKFVAALRGLATAQAAVAATGGAAPGVGGVGGAAAKGGGLMRGLGVAGGVLGGGALLYGGMAGARNGAGLGDIAAGAGGGALLGGTIGSVVPGIGTLIGAGVGGLVGGGATALAGAFGRKASPARGGGGSVDASTNLAPGAVVIDASGMSEAELARLIPREIESHARQRSERGVRGARG